MNYPVFVKGQIMESKTNGRVKFVGMDRYMGEETYCFESLTYGGRRYWLPETLHQHLDMPPPAEELKQLKAEAYDVWQEKTEWVQKQIDTFPNPLGKHRADVMREEIERLRPMEQMLNRIKELLTNGDKCKGGLHPWIPGSSAKPLLEEIRNMVDCIRHRIVINDAVCSPWQDMPEIRPATLTGLIAYVEQNGLDICSLKQAGTFEHVGCIFDLGDRNQFKLPYRATDEELLLLNEKGR